MAERKIIYQTLTQYLWADTFAGGFGVFMGFINDKKSIDDHKTWPLTNNDVR